MGAFGDLEEFNPVTNRGVELAEATFRGAGMSDRGPHDSGQNGPWARGYSSQRSFKQTDPKGRGQG